MAKKLFTVRLDEETFAEVEKIMKARRWGQQVMGEYVFEQFLKSVEQAKKQAQKQAQTLEQVGK